MIKDHLQKTFPIRDIPTRGHFRKDQNWGIFSQGHFLKDILDCYRKESNENERIVSLFFTYMNNNQIQIDYLSEKQICVKMNLLISFELSEEIFSQQNHFLSHFFSPYLHLYLSHSFELKKHFLCVFLSIIDRRSSQ